MFQLTQKLYLRYNLANNRFQPYTCKSILITRINKISAMLWENVLSMVQNKGGVCLRRGQRISQTTSVYPLNRPYQRRNEARLN